MPEHDKDAGVIAVLMEQFRTHRLPRALSLKEKVERGERLDDGDIGFLERVFADAHQVKRLADKYPEYQTLCARVAHLYHEITEKALENEKRA